MDLKEFKCIGNIYDQNILNGFIRYRIQRGNRFKIFLNITLVINQNLFKIGTTTCEIKDVYKAR